MNKSALIFGSSGLVGSALLKMLLESSTYNKVVVFVRKNQRLTHPKMDQVIVDFDHIDAISDWIKGNDIFICLGTTMAKAGSKEAFYKVDYTYVMQVASLAASNQVKKMIIISSMGADPDSSIYYSRVKGKVERDLQKFKFDAIYILRPSLLLGERKEKRVGERIAIILSKWTGFIFNGPLRKYKPIYDKNVAAAMLLLANGNLTGTHIYESREIEQIVLHQENSQP